MSKNIVIILLTSCAFVNTAYADCFKSAATRYSVPEAVLRSIAKVESGNRHLAVNFGGKAYYPDTISKAMRIVNKNAGRSFDIGMMQINKWWFDRFNYPYEWGFNLCWNTHFGAYVLAYELIRANGNIWKAVGRYHSPKKERQDLYIRKVYKEMQHWLQN